MTTKCVEVKNQEPETVETIERTRAHRTYAPSVDILENQDAIIVIADMPGVDENSIDITLEKNVLTIDGTVEQTAPEGFELIYSEYGSGDYHRAFTLTEHIDREKIEANFKNGVLRLSLPKAETAKSRKIEVKAG